MLHNAAISAGRWLFTRQRERRMEGITRAGQKVATHQIQLRDDGENFCLVAEMMEVGLMMVMGRDF